MSALVLPLWAEVAVAVLLVVGAAFALVGSWGLAKLGDFYKRLHGPSKATTLGVGCVLIASGLAFAVVGQASLHELLITLVLLVTAPVSAHLLVKAALQRDPAQRPPLPLKRPMPPGQVADGPPAAGTESPRPSR
jgi:multicomponent K+:H+ antiporter subunit G